jgi:hypothetical protein
MILQWAKLQTFWRGHSGDCSNLLKRVIHTDTNGGWGVERLQFQVSGTAQQKGCFRLSFISSSSRIASVTRRKTQKLYIRIYIVTCYATEDAFQIVNSSTNYASACPLLLLLLLLLLIIIIIIIIIMWRNFKDMKLRQRRLVIIPPSGDIFYKFKLLRL